MKSDVSPNSRMVFSVIMLVKKQIPSFLLSYNRPKRVFFSPKLPIDILLKN